MTGCAASLFGRATGRRTSEAGSRRSGTQHGRQPTRTSGHATRQRKPPKRRPDAAGTEAVRTTTPTPARSTRHGRKRGRDGRPSAGDAAKKHQRERTEPPEAGSGRTRGRAEARPPPPLMHSGDSIRQPRHNAPQSRQPSETGDEPTGSRRGRRGPFSCVSCDTAKVTAKDAEKHHGKQSSVFCILPHVPAVHFGQCSRGRNAVLILFADCLLFLHFNSGNQRTTREASFESKNAFQP